MILYHTWLFSDPAPVWLWNPLAVEGIYAIQRMDSEWAPHPIYFGRTEEFSGHGTVSFHHAFRSWVREAGSEVTLWISVHREASATQRLLKHAALIQKYAPVCNVQVTELVPPAAA